MPIKYRKSKIPAEFRGKGKRFTTMMTKTPVGGLYRSTALIAKKVAKATVHKEAEDKFISYSGSALFNSTITAASECYAMVPQITVGDTDYQRTGVKVRGKYLYIKGYVQLDKDYLDMANNGGNQWIPPATCRIMILSQKNIRVGSEVGTRVDTAHLLKDNVGTGSARPYSGGAFDNIAPINKQLFRVHLDKKVKFSWVGRSDTGNGTLEGYAVGQERTKYFECRIKVPATLTWDNGNGDWPNNFAPFLCFGSVNDDGSLPYSVGTPWRVSWLSTLYYEDS